MEITKSAQRLLLPLFLIFYFLSGEGRARQLVSAAVQQDWRPTKLFVFGDSFAATGNNDKDTLNTPWNFPYGKTFPGKPTGRYSDGRVLTDFIAKFVGVKSPISYKLRNKVAGNYLKYGMNFAYADTGVTNISYYYSNLTTQIDNFRRIIEGERPVYNTADLDSSVALVTVSGDDYESYIFSMEGQTPANDPLKSWKSFSTSVVNQIAISLKRIHDLGVNKVLVTALEPMGCLPTSTAVFSYKKCNQTRNILSRSHNLLLKQAVDKLNNQAKRSSFIILDLYTAFMSALNHKGSIRFRDGLKPCCAGATPGYPYGCGTVPDIPGEDTYTICESEAAAFFWDYAHPTQQGWFAVYSNLKATLKKLQY